MAFNPFKVLKSLLIQKENSLNPDKIEIKPNGSAGTTTIIQSSQTANRTITVPDATDTLATVTQVNTVQTNLDNHINDTTDAHDASAISNVPAGTISATDVQAAVNELDGDIQGHITDSVDAHDASAISNIPAGTIAATDVQAAINELDGDIQGHISDSSDAHDASAISVVPTGNLTSTDVQAGLVELQTQLDGVETTANAAANKTLSNLTSPTSINQHLLPDADGTRNLGSASLEFGEAHVNQVRSAGDLLLNPVNDIDANNKIIKNVAAPTSSLHAVNKEYVDNVAAGLDPKQAVRVATTAPLGGTYATTPSNGRFTGAATSVDSVTLVAGDRVLVKDQVDQKQNGIYVYDGAGQYTRSPDMDGSPASEVSAGNYTFATQGTVNVSSGFVLTGNGIFTLNTDNLVFTQFSGSGGASRTLDNLLAPTAINQNLLPDSNLSRDLGSASLRYQNLHTNIINTTTVQNLTGGISLSSSNDVAVRSGGGFPALVESSNTTTSNSGTVTIKSGTGTGSFIQSGSVTVTSGTSANSSSGNLNLSTGNASLSSGDIAITTGTGSPRGQVSINASQVNVNSTKIVNLADPTALQDAATKAYVDANSGIGNLDAMFRQDFDNAVLANFTQTGLDLTTTNPIKGTRSARLPHAAASTNSFKQVIAVDRKFRGQSMTISFDMQSTAVQGDVTLNIYDETNAANIVASEQISTLSSVLTSVTTTSGSSNIVVADQVEVNNAKVGERVTGAGIPANSVITAINTSTRTLTLSQNATASATVSLRISDMPSKRSVSFLIPNNCSSISYTISALQEPNTPETYIDDLLIELAEYAKTSTSVEVPIVTEWQSYTPITQGFGAPTFEMFWRRVGSNVEIRGELVSGTPTAVEARIGLPSGLTSANTSLLASPLNKVGSGNRQNANGSELPIFVEPGVTYVTFGISSVSSAGYTKQTGSALTGSGEAIILFASVPIQGWSATESQNIELTSSVLDQEVDSTVRLDTYNGYGSSFTRIPRFANIRQNIGDAIQYQDSATEGASFTALKDGIYSFMYAQEGAVGQASTVGLSRNATPAEAAANVITLAVEKRLSVSFAAPGAGNTNIPVAQWTGYLAAGDVIRPHTNAVGVNTNAFCHFTASYEGKLKQVNINPNSKITIPTSELRMEGASTRGSTDTAIVRFDNTARLRGDAFTIVSDATVGTAITMRKAGKLDISITLFTNTQQTVQITRNQSVRTAVSATASEILSSSWSNVGASSDTRSQSWSGFVQAGDIIRVASAINPVSSVNNSLNLAFQEQDIAVAVTNIQPKFSEADSSVRVDGANGYGSTGTRVRRFSNIRDNIGADIEYVDSTTDGARFVVKSSGIYHISYSDVFNNVGGLSLTKNASSLSTNPNLLPASEVLSFSSTAGSGFFETVSWQGSLIAGDIIRAQTQGLASGSDPQIASFTISKVGKPNITAVDVTPFVEIPQPQTQAIEALTVTSTYGSTNTGVAVLNITRNTTSGIVNVVSNATEGTSFVALKRCSFNITASFSSSIANSFNLYITRNSTTLTNAGAPNNAIARSVGAVANGNEDVSANVILEAGDVIRLQRENANASTIASVLVTAEALSDQILTEVETFSTDTASLVYAPSSTYTLTTLANAPVGTFITFTYAANTNTRTQTTTAPTQSVLDMNTNGIQIFTRAYNASSTAAQPAAVAIQIGKGMKGRALELYKSTAKTTSGSLDRFEANNNSHGFVFKEYDEKTGILFLDAAFNNSTATACNFLFSDNTTQTNGYLVINASKNPALAGVNVDRQVVAASYWASANKTTSTTQPLDFDSKEYDTHNAVQTGSGWKFTAPITGIYRVSGVFDNTTGTVGIILYKNNVAYKVVGWDNTAIVATYNGSIALNAGDYIDIRSNGGAITVVGGALATSGTATINIERIGNRG